jgi:hypothetical protein
MVSQIPWASPLSDVEVLLAMGRKQMLSVFPPDQPLRTSPRVDSLRLVQPWAVLEIPFGDWLCGLSRDRFLGGHP